MVRKKAKTTDAATFTGQGKKRRRSNNVHGIVFKDSKQEETYEKLVTRRIVSTRYPDYNCLSTLDLKDNVKMLFNNVGWTEFMRVVRFTYEGLTLEFLSSLNFYEDKINVLNPNHTLSFRLFNVDFELTLTDFCERLGFENAGAIHDSKNPATKPDGFNPQAFWSQITGETHYVAQHAKASLIHNPVLRYVHRAMACTLFARGEAGGVRVSELFILWAMLHGQAVNTGYYLINHLAAVAANDRGPNVAGGVVTFIAEKLGFNDKLDALDEVKGKRKIDLNYLDNMNMLKPVNARNRENFYLLINSERSILLPNPARTDTRLEANWLYPPVARVNQEEGQAQQRVEEPAEQVVEEDPIPPNFNLQEWCQRVEGEQQRQGAELQLLREEQARQSREQLGQSQQMGQITDMLQSLIHHFNLRQLPPPGQP